jgi:outer membrane receptor protein involved in Fe transport
MTPTPGGMTPTPGGMTPTPGGMTPTPGGGMTPTPTPTPPTPTTLQEPSFTLAGQTPREGATAATSPGAIQVAGGQSQPRAALDTGDFLARSQEATGVEIQRRSPTISDPRIRGYRFGQVLTIGDGAPFFPARLDLDTAVSKIDSSILRDVIVVKGPYAVRYGPSFSFIDVATFDPLLGPPGGYQNGPEYHGRTSSGYQSNGQRIDGLQAFWGGGPDWGFFVSYGIRVGNNYEAGNDYSVPSSYNSQPWNFAVAARLTKNSFIEFHGLHLDLRNTEFAGVYFDINRLTTDAESIHYEIDDQDYFNRFALDVWYNRTSADGDTHQGAKQFFLATFLTKSFFPNGNVINGVAEQINDRSNTNFYNKTRGYRATLSWGDKDCPQLHVGTDFNYLSQQLQENIDWIEPGGAPVPAFNGMSSATQQLGIPNSHLSDPGIFLEANVPWGKRFNIRTGVRTDWAEANSSPREVTGTIPLFFNQPPGPFGSFTTSFNPIIFSTQPFNNDLRNEYFLWSAFIDASYKIDEHWTVAGQFAYAMRPPTPTELYATGPFIDVLQQGLNRLYGDPHLSPEKVYQLGFDIRGNYSFLRAGVSGFYAWIHDYITYDANALGTSTAGPISQVIFTNTDLATLAGGEVFLDVDVTDWLAAFANLTYVQGWDRTHIDFRRAPDLVSSRRTIPQEPLPSIPPLEGRVGLRVHQATSANHRQPRWSVESYVRLVDHQHYVATSLGEQPTPGFAVWDLRSYWQVLDPKGHPSPRNPGLLLTAGVENIGNKFYREHLDPLAGSPTDLLFRPGTNVYVGAQLEY